RDVTTQRAGSYSAYASRAEAALREGLALEELLNRRQADMERIKKLFESTWSEHMRQVRIEQEVFQTQVCENYSTALYFLLRALLLLFLSLLFHKFISYYKGEV